MGYIIELKSFMKNDKPDDLKDNGFSSQLLIPNIG